MSTTSSVDDLSSHVLIGDCNSFVKQLQLDTDHLYRHLTEVNGKDTRGGYIEGLLEFQDAQIYTESSFALKISLVSAGADKRILQSSKRLHPNLLYMTRFDGNKRNREAEAATPMWRIDLEITNGEVYWWTESESQPLYKQKICELKMNEETNTRSILDLKDLHLTVITPLVRTNVNGIRVKDGLAMRRPLFEDDMLDDESWEDIVRKLDKFYTGRDGKAEMDRICLQFDIHNMTDGNEEPKPLCSIISYPIVNSKSRNLGILDLVPNTVSAQKACCSVSREIYLPSKFKLPNSEKDAYPRFVVQYGNDIFVTDERIKQPSDVKIFASQMFIFKTPTQDEEAIGDIYARGGRIFLEAYRPKDKQSSAVKHEFKFQVHSRWGNSNIDWCSFCLENPDRLGQSMEESLKHRLQTAGVAKRGTKRRKKDTASVMSSPDINHDVEILNGDSPLYNDLENYVDPSVDVNNLDIDEFLRQDIPDVLQDALSPGSDMTPSPDHQDLLRSLSPEAPYLSQPPGCPAPSSARPLPPGCSAPGYFFDNEDMIGACYTDSSDKKPKIKLDYDSIPGSSVQDLTPKKSNKRSLFNPMSIGSPAPAIVKQEVEEVDCVETDSKSSISTRSLIDRINNLNRSKHRGSLASADDSAYKSQDSLCSSPPLSETGKNDESDVEDYKPKVLDLKNKFEGAKDKCMEKIKSKINKSDEEKQMIHSKKADCFPAFVFMMTPIAVVALAVILNFFWSIYTGVSDLLT